MFPNQADWEARLSEAWQTMFYGPDDQRLFFPTADGMGYMVDTGNNDARTEGMSYGMMMAVQMGDKDVFDRLWLWSWTHMLQKEGRYRGYFAWSCNLDGTKRAQGPASDGEEYFALALFFAGRVWGEGAAPFDYTNQARSILRTCLHPGPAGPQDSMWDLDNGLIKFVPDTPWTDPSYHLPHFYDLFARWADEADRPFWTKAAAASRAYLPRACHPVTGLAPEYSNYDGSPYKAPWDYGHHYFYSDSYRVAANLGLEALWSGHTATTKALADKILDFFDTQDPADLRMYTLDGTPLEEPALHPVGLLATNAFAALATDGPVAQRAFEQFWNTPLRTGPRRYYDNCLYLFALLGLSGRYRIL